MKTVVVTGATGGLGSNLVKQLNKDYDVVCVYRNQRKFDEIFWDGKNLKQHLTNNEDDFSTLSAKIDTPDEIILVLNAFAIEPIKTIGTYTAKEIEDMTDGNIKQTVMIINELVGLADKNNVALRIINIDSGAADFPLKGWGNYCASKAYVNAFLAVVASEHANIKIVSVDPGVMDTKMQESIRATDVAVFDKVNDFKNYKDTGVLRQPCDVAKYIIEKYIDEWKANALREKIVL